MYKQTDELIWIENFIELEAHISFSPCMSIRVNFVKSDPFEYVHKTFSYQTNGKYVSESMQTKLYKYMVSFFSYAVHWWYRVRLLEVN